jgi:hypothetical protein
MARRRPRLPNPPPRRIVTQYVVLRDGGEHLLTRSRAQYLRLALPRKARPRRWLAEEAAT